MEKKLTEREIIKKQPVPYERLDLLNEIYRDYKDVYQGAVWAVLQAYSLGYMDGQRAERARRKGQ